MALDQKNIYHIDQRMIPQGRKGSPTNRAIQAQVVRAGTRSAGMGERNIHHADCIYVNANVLAGGTAPENTRAHPSKHTPARWMRETGAGGTTAPGSPADTAWLSHTRQYTLFFS